MSMSRDVAARIRRQESREYRLVYGLTLPLFLVAAALDRLFGTRSGTGARGSLIGEARDMAHSAIPFAYMR